MLSAQTWLLAPGRLKCSEAILSGVLGTWKRNVSLGQASSWTLHITSSLPSHWPNEHHELPLEDLHNYMIHNCGIPKLGHHIPSYTVPYSWMHLRSQTSFVNSSFENGIWYMEDSVRAFRKENEPCTFRLPFPWPPHWAKDHHSVPCLLLSSSTSL